MATSLHVIIERVRPNKVNCSIGDHKRTHGMGNLYRGKHACRDVESPKPLSGVRCFYRITSRLPNGISVWIDPPKVLQNVLSDEGVRVGDRGW